MDEESSEPIDRIDLKEHIDALPGAEFATECSKKL